MSNGSLMNKAWEKGEPPSMACTEHNPPKRVAPWSIERMCMQDEEVFSLVYLFFNSSVPCWTEIQFPFDCCWMQNLEPVKLMINQAFLPNNCWLIYRLKIFLQLLSNYFLTPIFWKLSFSQSNWVCHRKVRIQAICFCSAIIFGHMLCVLDNKFFSVLGIKLWNRDLLRSEVNFGRCEI